jgi:hypothetical protein
MATNQDTNRRSLYDIIKNEFVSTKTDKIFTYDQWFNLFFKDANTLSDQSSTGDKKGKTKYNNLYSIINFKKILNGDETIINYYFQPSAKNSTTWRKRLTTKQEFYKTFACDLPWAKSLNFCKGQNININIDESFLKSLVGNYVSDKKTDGEFKIFESTSYTNIDEPFKLGISSYYFSYLSGTLDNARTEGQNIVFDITIDTSREDISNKVKSLFPNLDLTGFKPTISFSKDGKSFNYDILNHKGTATKTEEDSSNKSDSTSKTDTTSKTDSTKKSDDEKPYKPNQTTIYSTTTDYNKIDEPNLTIKNCNSFPFELGCKNSLIGDLNQKFFGNRRQDTYTKLLQNRLDNRAYFSIDNEEKMITKEIWDQIMKSKIVKETVKKVLKEYINKKK